MRIAALFDIHGNLPALEAVLEEVRQAGADLIVAGGDVVFGPMPRETLELLLRLDIPVQFIEGNCETAMLAEMRGEDASAVGERYRVAFRWAAQQLQPEYEATLASWPLTLRLDVEGLGQVLFCHATPRNDNEVFTRLTAEERLLPVFKGVDASVVVCGHTHMQFDRMVGGIRVVNAGSVGTPFGKPGADWLLLGPDVQFRHSDYDLAKGTERIRGTRYPNAQEYADRDLLNPPSEQEILERYSAFELK